MLDKVVIITGGAAGQGLAEARLLAREGASVVIADLTDASEVAEQELEGRGLYVRHDVSSRDDWAGLMSCVERRYGRLDVLVNNAGVFKPFGLLETTDENWDLHYRVNQLGTFLGMKAAIEPMKRAGGGSIINVSSIAGLLGAPGVFAYSASKWAVRGMTKLAATDLGPIGIRVNSIYPGSIDTGMLDLNPQARSDAAINAIPLRRLGVPQDVAHLVRFLASDESSYISGAEISITGGM